MAKSREDSVSWSLRKAEEYLESARKNIDESRLFPAAEEIFRAVETTLEALLYHFGTKKIEYPGKKKKFTGRLALQFLIRDNLARTARISQEEYDRYLALASELHLAGYDQGRIFELRELERDLGFAEDLQTKAKSITKR
jgi:HEPN domain-containing protein